MYDTRTIAVVTGSRAEYGYSRPVLEALKKYHNVKTVVVVTGMHLSRKFGYTVHEIEKDGYCIGAKIPILSDRDSHSGVAESLGVLLTGLVRAFEKIRPGIILISGDRGEMLMSAVAGLYMNIPVAHTQSGEISGHVDGIGRHAITKMAHIHFAANEEAAKRVKNLGEESWRIHTVGAPLLDEVVHNKFIPKKDLAKKFGLDTSKPIVLLAQHPVIFENKESTKHMREILSAITELAYQTILIYPNADAGGRSMIDVIEQYSYSFLKKYKSLPRTEFLSLMKIADVMVGNSCSGIEEAPSFHLPVVNIGTRQKGRMRAENVIDVGYDREEIKKAIEKALFDERFKARVKKCKNQYGDGKSGERIARILANLKISDELLQKKITY